MTLGEVVTLVLKKNHGSFIRVWHYHLSLAHRTTKDRSCRHFAKGPAPAWAKCSAAPGASRVFPPRRTHRNWWKEPRSHRRILAVIREYSQLVNTYGWISTFFNEWVLVFFFESLLLYLNRKLMGTWECNWWTTLVIGFYYCKSPSYQWVCPSINGWIKTLSPLCSASNRRCANRHMGFQ